MERLIFYTRHSFNDLAVNGRRTLFALLCIAAGVAAIVSLQTLGVMIDDSLTGSLQESNRGDIRITPTDFFGGEDEDIGEADQRGVNAGVLGEGDNFTPIHFTPEGIERISEWFQENYPGSDITYLQMNNSSSSGLSINHPQNDLQKTFVQSYIVDGQTYPLYGERESEDGVPMDEMLQEPTDIVISRNLADDLDASVGDTLSLSGASQDFTLRGIVDTAAEGGFENFIGALFGYYYIDHQAIDLFPDFEVGATQLFVKLGDPGEVEAAQRRFDQRYPYVESFSTTDLEELNSEIADNLNQLVILMGLISLLIGGIGIVNTMLVIVSRRTTEVAVLKTIGLEGEQVTILFLVEAVIMGIAGSILGILFGWMAAYLLQDVAGRFIAQSLSFRITLAPALTGLVTGIVVTAIFGFIPTLAAGQVRPNLVLRPSDAMVPKAGRARSFAALLVVMLALSLVAQALTGSLLTGDILRQSAMGVGGFLGALLGLTLVAGGLLAGWARRNVLLRVFRWGLFLFAIPAAGAAFGYAVPALLILFQTFILVGILYVVLWVLIWSVGGGALSDIWLIKPKALSSFNRALSDEGTHPLVRNPIVSLLVLLGAFVGTLAVWAINAVVVVVMIPFYLLGRLVQRLAFIDLKLSLRSMLAAKGRNASTLLALVIGVFTLSLITMLTKAITDRFEELLVDEVGGNVIIFAAGSEQTRNAVNEDLAAFQAEGAVESYSSLGTYGGQLLRVYDEETDRFYNFSQLEAQARRENPDFADSLGWNFDGVDGRELQSNLPSVDFSQGRQLDPVRDAGPWDGEDSYPPIVIPGDEAVNATVLDVGDLMVFQVNGADEPLTFEVVGMIDRTGGDIEVNFGSDMYAPINAFPEDVQPQFINAIAEVKESEIPRLRRTLNETPGVFVLETRLLNDLINQIIDQFTSFPILVAALSLIVGGIVIANSVALSTLERRREIAIMKSVGLQRERVLGMLLMEYGLMGLIGGLIGVGIGGVGLLLLLTQAFGGELGESIPIWTAIELMLLCVGIALAAAVVSAWGASGEKPLNVLRYE